MNQTKLRTDMIEPNKNISFSVGTGVGQKKLILF